ncbi:hypothetical protein ACH5RR_008757 [Cinchona calisaya]|uniref:Uncharacterized protein n=1 Tax=Cinchona calisaya TaxID=153742 RepID=A0ABD3AFV6_9GENT
MLIRKKKSKIVIVILFYKLAEGNQRILIKKNVTAAGLEHAETETHFADNSMLCQGDGQCLSNEKMFDDNTSLADDNGIFSDENLIEMLGAISRELGLSSRV